MPVKIESNVDLGPVLGEVRSALRGSIEANADRVLGAIRDEWTGWKNPTGASKAGFVVETSDDALTVSNREDYAGLVHRAGESEPYIDQVMVRVQAKEIDAMMEEAAERILDSILEG